MKRRRRAGMSMAITLVVLLTLSVLAVAFGALGINNLSQIRQSEAQTALVHAANGGLNALMDTLYSTPTYGSGVTNNSADGSGTYATSQGTAYYWWTFNPASSTGYCLNNLGSASTRTAYQGRKVPPLTAYLVVNADWVPRNLSKKPLRISAVASKKFRFAVATDGTMDTRNIKGVTGYPGSVWSNATGSDTIEATSIDGQAFSNSSDGSIDVQQEPKGVPYYNSGTTPIPDIPIPDVVASYSTAGISGNHPYGGPGFFQGVKDPLSADSDLRAGNLVLKTYSDGTLEIIKGAVIMDRGQGQYKGVGYRISPPPPGQPPHDFFVPGTLFLGQASGTTIAPGMNFMVGGSMTLNGSVTQLPPNGEHKDNFFFVAGMEKSGSKTFSIRFNGAQGSSLHMFAEYGIFQNGSSQYAGVVYVRDGSFEIQGGGTNSSYEGAVLIRSGGSGSGNLDASSANFTYNADLTTAMDRFNVSFSENTPVYPLSWWIER